MNPEPISLGLGIAVGLLVGIVVRVRRRKVAANHQVRDLTTRITSLNLRLDRSQTELVATKKVVARLLEERQKYRGTGSEPAGGPSPLMLILNDTDPLHLSNVKGIGPKLAVSLASYGITDLKRLAEIGERELAVIEATSPALVERLVRERWKEQATELLHHSPPMGGHFSPIGSSYSDSEDDEFSWENFRNPGQEQAVHGSSS